MGMSGYGADPRKHPPFEGVYLMSCRQMFGLGASHANYDNQTRTHLSLNKDSPVTRPIETVGCTLPIPIPGRIASLIRPDLVSDRDTALLGVNYLEAANAR